MSWIHIGFSADPDNDPVFYLNADPDPGQTLTSQKVNCYMKNIKSLFERQEIRVVCEFRSNSLLLDLDPHSQLTDRYPDPGEPNQGGSGSTTQVRVIFCIHLPDWNRIYLALLDLGLYSRKLSKNDSKAPAI